MAREHRVVSLFSGAGGLDWGFRELGFEIVFANDVLPAPMLTYARNFGLKLSRCAHAKPYVATRGEALICDVAHVDFSELAKLGVDVVLGGPPCQDFTVLRNGRAGIQVSRGRLYAHFVRALAQLQPKVFVFENVPGLKSANNGLAYSTIVSDFEKLNLRYSEMKWASYNRVVQGYRAVFSDVVDFAELGVPQRRKRLVIIGVRRDLVKQPEEIGKLVSKLIRPRNALAKYPLTPLEAFEGRALPELQNEYAEIMKRWEGVWLEVGTPRARAWKREVWDKLTFDAVKDYLLANEVKACNEREIEGAWREHEEVLRELGYYGRRVCESPPPDGTCALPEEDVTVRERLKRIPPGENHEFARGTAWGVKGHVSQYYRRLHPLRPSYTVIARGGGGTYGYHYDRDRATLSLREKARLQAFPDTFLFAGTRTEIRAQIGEAVPPLVGKRIAEVVARTLELLGPQ